MVLLTLKHIGVDQVHLFFKFQLFVHVAGTPFMQWLAKPMSKRAIKQPF